jgi:hypothetical protein
VSARSFAGRLKTICVVGGVPAGGVVGFGDFFSPVGGWMLSIGAGVLALMALAAMLVRAELRERVRKVTDQSEETQGLFEGPVVKQTGLWCLLVFGVAGILVGVKSHEKAGEGGLLAGASTSAADFQGKTLGLLAAILDTQKQSTDVLRKINDTAKKETSKDPRKELANQGVAWTSDNMFSAIRDRDAKTLQLFVEGGMLAPTHSLQLAIYRFDKNTAAIFASNPDVIDADDCSGMTRYDQTHANSPAKLALVRAVCDRQDARDALLKRLEEDEDQIRAGEKANSTVASDRVSCLSRLKREWPVGRLASVPFPGEINGNLTVGDIPEEYAASAVSQYLLTTPGTTSAQLAAAYQRSVGEACDRSFENRPVDTGERDFLKTVLRGG